MITRKRKVIQITSGGFNLFALCNDGSMWRLTDDGWLPVLSVPPVGSKRSFPR